MIAGRAPRRCGVRCSARLGAVASPSAVLVTQFPQIVRGLDPLLRIAATAADEPCDDGMAEKPGRYEVAHSPRHASLLAGDAEDVAGIALGAGAGVPHTHSAA